MRRFLTWSGVTIGLSSLTMLSMGCAYGDIDEEEVDEAPQAQVDPGLKDYITYDIRDGSSNFLGYLLVTATSGGGYTANREYWYLTSNLSNSSSHTFNADTSDYWSNPPPDLGTLSFVTNRSASWSSDTPSNNMLLHTDSGSGERIGIDWQMTYEDETWTGTIEWWHSVETDFFGTGTNTTLSPGTPASGTWYSYTTSPL